MTKTLKIECDKYRFDEKNHKHYINNREVTGTTTVVGVIDKPALMPWAVNLAMKKLLELGLTEENIEKAKKAPIEAKQSAGRFGTVVHALAEHFNKTGDVISADSEELPDEVRTLVKTLTASQTKKANKLIAQYVEWFKKVGAKVHYVEQNVFSETEFVGGIFDLVLEIDGKIYLTDFKTSSGVYPSQFVQMGGYHLQLEEMMDRDYIPSFEIDGYIVIHVPQKGRMKEYRKTNTDIYKRAFRACLYIYRLINDQTWKL